MSVSPVSSLTPGAVVTASPQRRQEMLRQAVDEVVGSMFFAPMLEMARDNPFKADFAHGGRGEEMFGTQLDMELARRASHQTGGSLNDVIYDRLAKYVH